MEASAVTMGLFVQICLRCTSHSDAFRSPCSCTCGQDLCLLDGADGFSGEDLDARNEALDWSLKVAVASGSRVSSHGLSGATVLTELWLVCGSLVFKSWIWNAGTVAVRDGRVDLRDPKVVRGASATPADPVNRTFFREKRSTYSRFVGLGTEAGVPTAGDINLARV